MPYPEVYSDVQYVLRQFGACPEALEWALDCHSLEQLWEDCPDPEWLLLSLKGLDHCEEPKLRLFAVACARRHSALFSDERCCRILEVAEAVATGKKQNIHLQPAFDDAFAVSNDAGRLLDWDESRHAAIRCVQDTVRQQPWDAARRAIRNGQRASRSARRESYWQLQELRRILEPDVPLLTRRARELLTGG